MDTGFQQSLPNIKLRQYQALLEVVESIAAHHDLSSLLRDLNGRLQQVVRVDSIDLGLYDPKSNLMRMHTLESSALSRSQLYSELPIEETPYGQAWQTQQPMLVTDLGAYESRYPQTFRELSQYGIKTLYMLPLSLEGKQLGTLGFGSLNESAWSEDEQELLRRVVKLLAVIIDNVIDFEDARSEEIEGKRRFDQLGLLMDVGKSIVSHLDLRELIGVISDYLKRVINCDGVLMSLYEPESGQLYAYVLDTKFNADATQNEGRLVSMEGTPGAQAIKSLKTIMVTRADLENSPSPVAQHIAAQGVKSGCIAPLIWHGQALGTISMVSLREDAFTEEDAELLTQIASQIAIAVENAHNFERAREAEQELSRKLNHLRLMLKITTALVSQLDLPELIQVISSSVREVIEIDAVSVSLFDYESNELRAFATDVRPGNTPRERGFRIPLEGTPIGLAFTSGQPVFVDKFDLDIFSSDVFRRVYEDGYRSGGSVPLVTKGRKLGVIGFANKREYNFSDGDKEVLCQVANQVAIAVDNALNFERARKAEQQAIDQSERLQLLLEINNAVASHLDLPSLMKAISSCLDKVSHYDTMGLALYDPETNQMRAYANPADETFIEEGQIIPLEGSVVGLTFTTGQPILLSSFEDERFQSDWNKQFRKAGFKSGGCVPLIVHGRKLGTLGVARRREVDFSKDEVELLCQVANQVAIAVENAMAFREIQALKNKLASEKLYLEDEIRTEHNFEELIGTSPSFKRILKQVETVAPTDSAVLIRGETGTGKELLARAIHSLSARRERTLVKLNCAAIPTGLLESELFGHEKGAFTGAISQRIGRFELANKGTLFLDEVGDIPMELQPKLLRVLQEQEFERLGSTRTQKVDVRLIAATNCDLEEMVADKKYRSDLYYRLNVFPVTIPPLRERREDIPALTRFFTQKYSRRLKKQITGIPADALTALTAYPWPGNVRELEHFIERAVILTSGSDLEVSLSELKGSEQAPPAEFTTLVDNEREHIRRALEESHWVVGGPNGAAVRLGMKRTTLQSRMQRLGLERGKP